MPSKAKQWRCSTESTRDLNRSKRGKRQRRLPAEENMEDHEEAGNLASRHSDDQKPRGKVEEDLRVILPESERKKERRKACGDQHKGQPHQWQ
ncbi:hypothetical protein J1N35_023979 [Gossypium stocksii]|uniref:Uncharacterized protein n=1 Tax=Gossypium stocksii TaxID=47602 RepID=A0A9D4A3P3_9ROSI|nr:hypothetical protein J1N35_023979 [Gossypium stocksii]